MGIRFDGIGYSVLSGLPTPEEALTAYYDGKLWVYNGSAWVTFSQVDETSGESATIPMADGAQVLADDGVVGAPGYAFNGDANTGIWNSAPGVIHITSDGTDIVEIDGDGLEVITGQLQLPDGSESAPALANTGDLDTGIWFPAANVISFTSGGEEIVRNLTLLATTVNDSETELQGTGTLYLTIDDDYTYLVDMLVLARNVDNPPESALWKATVGIQRTSGTVSLVGSDTLVEVSNTPGWQVSLSADDTNKRLAIKVIGDESDTVHWKASVTAARVN